MPSGERQPGAEETEEETAVWPPASGDARPMEPPLGDLPPDDSWFDDADLEQSTDDERTPNREREKRRRDSVANRGRPSWPPTPGADPDALPPPRVIAPDSPVPDHLPLSDAVHLPEQEPGNPIAGFASPVPPGASPSDGPPPAVSSPPGDETRTEEPEPSPDQPPEEPPEVKSPPLTLGRLLAAAGSSSSTTDDRPEVPDVTAAVTSSPADTSPPPPTADPPPSTDHPPLPSADHALVLATPPVELAPPDQGAPGELAPADQGAPGERAPSDAASAPTTGPPPPPSPTSSAPLPAGRVDTEPDREEQEEEEAEAGRDPEAPPLDPGPSAVDALSEARLARLERHRQQQAKVLRERQKAILRRRLAPLLAAGAGLAVAASMPPWGAWPLAFVGIAVLDRLIADQPWLTRFARTWIMAVAWLYPATVWMWDMTPPGYVVAGAFFATYFAAAAALAPPGPERRLILPFTFALAEAARWSWPFGGVPLAHLALSQVDTPLIYLARLGGSLLVVVAVVVVGQALSALNTRDTYHGTVALATVAALVAGAAIYPRAEVVREVDVALVQGGGPQRTRASSDQQPVVLARHVEAAGLIDQPVDLVILPENVVNPGRYLTHDDARALVQRLATDHDASVLAGWFYPINDVDTVNYQSTITPDGQEIDRYDKVGLVPFGEYVPLRTVIEQLNDEIPARDVVRGTAEPVLDTPVGPVGVAISWEGFFETRSREAVRNGAELLTNPTNGSSYWLTLVQSQQVASNQLRAVENDRWVLQVAPTGYSAVIDPDGRVIRQTGISERAVLIETVEMRRGQTPATRLGFLTVFLATLAAIAVGYRQTPRIRPVALGDQAKLQRRH